MEVNRDPNQRGTMNQLRAVLVTAAALLILGIAAAESPAQLPDPGVTIDAQRTALLVTDPQNDFLSLEGVTWGVVGESVAKNNTVENIESLLETSKQNGKRVFVSPLEKIRASGYSTR